MLCLATGVWACGGQNAVREEPIKPVASSSQEQAKPFPHLEADQVWVSSVQAGLTLYVGGAVEERFLKGVTPQIVSLVPGRHTVTVVTAPGVEPIVDRSRGLTEESRVRLPAGAIAVSYGIEKQPEKPLSVIVLAYPEGVTHERLGDHYPRDVTFAPPPGGRAAIYGMMRVPDALRDVATSLLARGSKYGSTLNRAGYSSRNNRSRQTGRFPWRTFPRGARQRPAGDRSITRTRYCPHWKSYSDRLFRP